MATSTVNLTITIEHNANLPEDAQGIARMVCRAVATGTGTVPPGHPVVLFGRVAIIGPEDGPNVRVRLQSAAITTWAEYGSDPIDTAVPEED